MSTLRFVPNSLSFQKNTEEIDRAFCEVEHLVSCLEDVMVKPTEENNLEIPQFDKDDLSSSRHEIEKLRQHNQRLSDEIVLLEEKINLLETQRNRALSLLEETRRLVLETDLLECHK